ncbi:MAG: hypothetical protein ACJ8BF_10825 [Gemmatimonadales bacterium]
MRVPQFAQRPFLALAAVAVTLIGCAGSSEPTVPFNPAGASEDVAAANATFSSPVYASFSSLSLLFDAALGGAPLVSGSAAALVVPAAGGKIEAAGARSLARISRMLPRAANRSLSAYVAAIPPEFLGKTFIYSGGTYVVSTETGAPANGVRFMLYEIDPLTGLPADPPLPPTGYVDITDFSTATTRSARIVVVSGGTTYLDYRVNVTSTATAGTVTVLGYVTDGSTRATFNLGATLTAAAGLTLVESIAVPERDLRIDLRLTENVTTLESSTGITMDLRGQNGWVRLTGQYNSTGGTLDVLVNGTRFATISEAVGTGVVITGADGLPLAPEELEALQRIFDFSGGAFLAFDQLVAPVGTFLGGV